MRGEERRTGKQMEEEKEVEGWGGGQVWWVWVFAPDYNFHFPISRGLGGRLRRKTPPRSLKCWSGASECSGQPRRMNTLRSPAFGEGAVYRGMQ